MYNTCKEFHIAFYEGLNKEASFQGDEFLDDEVDRLLTLGQNYVIEEFYTAHYENNEKLQVDLGKLIVKNWKHTLYNLADTVNPIATPYNPVFYCQLPYNFKYPINIRPTVRSINNCTTDQSLTSGEPTEYIAVVPFNQDLFSATDYPIDCVITYDQAGTPVTLFDLVNYNLTDINTEEQKFHLVQLILEELNRTNTNISGNTTAVNPINQYSVYNTYGIKVYWEYYGNYHYPNCFIFIASNVATFDKFIEIKIDSASTSSYNATSTNSAYYLIPGEKARGKFYTLEYSTNYYLSPTYNETVICRQLDEKKIYEFYNNPIQKPTRKRPYANISGNMLYIYLPVKSSTNEVYVDYIRQPRPFSLELGWSSEAGSNLHNNIVTKAVQLAMARIGDPNIQLNAQVENVR